VGSSEEFCEFPSGLEGGDSQRVDATLLLYESGQIGEYIECYFNIWKRSTEPLTLRLCLDNRCTSTAGLTEQAFEAL